MKTILLPSIVIAVVLGACSSAKENSAPLAEPVPAPKTQPGPQPDLGPLVKAAEPPPPISGGTLAVAKDGNTIVAADPDRDRVHVVDLASRAVRLSVELPKGSEPGRVAVDDAGRAHVALRGSHEIATIDLATGEVTRRPACTAPRGIAYRAAGDRVIVACASGELVSFAAGGGPALDRRTLGRDLRDVLVTKADGLKVTKFRQAKVLRVAGDGTSQDEGGLDGANLAWRAVAMPETNDGDQTSEDERVAVIAQEPTPEPVRTDPGGYGSSSAGLGGDCGTALGIVSTRLEIVGRGSVRIPSAVLPVDLATNGRELAVVAAGNAFTKQLPQIYVLFAQQVEGATDNCVPAVQGNVPGQAIAAAFDGKDELVVQTREPAAIHIMTEDRRRPWKTIALPGISVADTGHAIFHSNAGGFLACASCHAEGGDDGRTWTFVDMGPRRTPSLRGTTKGTEPFHWDGDMADLRHLVDNVFVGRMSGPKVDDAQLDALGGWMFTLPPPPRLGAETEAAVRGKTLFDQRCTSCHTGSMLTNNRSFDVGTGGTMQVPSLVGVAWRAPFIHTGCAETLFDRFSPACGGSAHGEVADLRRDQISDLVAFLETL